MKNVKYREGLIFSPLWLSHEVKSNVQHVSAQ